MPKHNQILSTRQQNTLSTSAVRALGQLGMMLILIRKRGAERLLALIVATRSPTSP